LEGVNVDGTRVGILDGLIRKCSIRIATGLMRLGDWLNLQELVVTVTAVNHIISEPQEIS
jgi:Mrp family chromosome partitioning ATPase